jgi:L1 cell adhesion molecule like protein
MDHPAIGIDLGTTYSCVAIYENDRPEVIVNDQGNRTTPSCIAFTPSERLVGDAAFNQILRNPHNTIFDIKRIIGRRFLDPEIQKDMRHWPFKVINHYDLPYVQIHTNTPHVNYSAEELSGMILTKMRNIAQEYVGSVVQRVVITVPAYFNASQRKATRNAGELANLDILQLVNEPTAAAIAYGLHRKSMESVCVLYASCMRREPYWCTI